MYKVLVSIQGTTLILPYQIKAVSNTDGSRRACYIHVQPTAELSKFKLRGLSPEMFCVNIADMVNLRGIFSGTVENEKQMPVARFSINQEDYLDGLERVAPALSHGQIAGLLRGLPHYIQDADGQFIDFEESVVGREAGGPTVAGGYRLTLVTADVGERIAPFAYYSMDTRTAEGWLGLPPPRADHAAIRAALAATLQAIAGKGIKISQVYDETDYGLLA